MVTGIVYSVPAHAPYDYLALEDLKHMENLEPGIREIVSWIKPVSIIKVEGYGDYPAVEEVRKLGVKSQEEYEKADIATQEVYRREYHKGVMKDNCGPISNLPVSEAKEIIKSILLEEGLASTMYDLPEEVICRCGTKCIVKILEDQWYLRYSDVKWKELAHEAVDKMNFYPPEVKKQFNYYIDWYEDWPCTRKTGLGTPFPFDKDWIVETLTDSTIYMAFYIISRYYNMNLIDPERVDDSFFDYVFLGEGDLDTLCKKTGLSKELLEKLRNDFIYWYPVDIRGSGKDLVGNHLTFFIFHHVAIFPPDKWPKSISVNGYVMLNGREMSKSKGNYISMKKAIEYVGADALRLSLLTLADGLDDPDWSLDKGINAVNRLNIIYNFYKEVFSSSGSCDSNDLHEKILLSEFNTILRDIDKYLKRHMIANAGKQIFYKLFDVFREYLNVSSKPNYCLLKKLLTEYVKLLSMYAPYLSEEIWHRIIGKNTYVSIEKWPEVEEEYVDSIYLDIKEYAKTIVEDIKHILNLLGEKGKEVNLIYSSSWKWDLIKKIQNEKRVDVKELIRLGSEIHGINKKDIAVYATFLSREWHGRYTKFRKLLITWSDKDESSFLRKYLSDFLRSEFPSITLKVMGEDEVDIELLSSLKKASYPLYPAIIIR
jgi:leucyl-tRNA synthetase